MVKIITATEAQVIDEALRSAYRDLTDLGVEIDELENLIDAIDILRGLKEKTIEEILT